MRHSQIVSPKAFAAWSAIDTRHMFDTDDRREYGDQPIVVGDEFLMIESYTGPIRRDNRSMLFSVTMVWKGKRPGQYRLRLKRITAWSDHR